MASIAHSIVAALLGAHGWVHFVYVASNQGWFGSGDGWVWNGRSWLLSRFFPERVILSLASVFFGLAGVGFIAGAVGLFFAFQWWMPVTVVAALLSTLLYIMLWDGRFADMPAKGALGVLINLVVIGWVVRPI